VDGQTNGRWEELHDQLEEQSATLDEIATDIGWIALAAKIYIAVMVLAVVVGVVATIATVLD
jgi:hypothetical protein